MIRKLLKWALRIPVYVVAVPIILFEDLLKDDLSRLMAAIARWQPVARLEAKVATLSRWAILGLFLVPMLVLFPVKLTAMWLIGTGHWLQGGAVLALAKVAGTSYSVRLFQIGKDRLLSFSWFAAVYRWTGQVREALRRLFSACSVCVALRERVKVAAHTARTAVTAALRSLRTRLRRSKRGGMRRRLDTLLRRRAGNEV